MSEQPTPEPVYGSFRVVKGWQHAHLERLGSSGWHRAGPLDLEFLLALAAPSAHPPAPHSEPVARVAIITLGDTKKAKVLRVLDERTGAPDSWIAKAPEGTLLYAGAAPSAHPVPVALTDLLSAALLMMERPTWERVEMANGERITRAELASRIRAALATQSAPDPAGATLRPHQGAAHADVERS